MSLIDPIVPLSSGEFERGTARRRAFKFAAPLAALVGGAGAWKLFRGSSVRAGEALVVAATAMVAYSLVHPAGALAFRKGWLRIGAALGRVNSAILLSVLYALVVTPLGMALRLVGRRSFTPARKGSYFIARGEQRDKRHFEHPY